MAEITVTEKNFQTEVTESELPVLLDFWASWCTPCRMLAPAVEAIAEKYAGKVKVGKVNVDEEPALADAFHVSSIPMVVLLQNKQVVDVLVGYRPQSELEAMLQKIR